MLSFEILKDKAFAILDIKKFPYAQAKKIFFPKEAISKPVQCLNPAEFVCTYLRKLQSVQKILLRFN